MQVYVQWIMQVYVQWFQLELYFTIHDMLLYYHVIVEQLVVLCPFQYTSVLLLFYRVVVVDLLVVLYSFQYYFDFISLCCISVQFHILS